MTSRRTAINCLLSAGFISVAGCTDPLERTGATGSGGDGGGGGSGSGGGEFRDERSEIAITYDESLSSWNDGTTTRDAGITAFNEEAFEEAIDEYDVALDHYRAAADGFAEAAEVAEAIGRDEARSLCRDAEANTEIQIQSTEAARDAAIAMRDEEGTDVVNEHIEQYQALLEEAEAVPVADADVVADAVDLD